MAEDFYDVSVMGSYAELHERGMGRRLRGSGDDASRGRRRVTWEDESERPSARGRGRDRGERGDVSASSAARDDAIASSSIDESSISFCSFAPWYTLAWLKVRRMPMRSGGPPSSGGSARHVASADTLGF